MPDFAFYHGTTAENAKRILRKGLDPRRAESRGPHTKGYAFLSETPEGAERFAPGGAFNKSPARGAVLKVEPPEHIRRKIRYDLGEFPRSPVKIPPEHISVHKYTNA